MLCVTFWVAWLCDVPSRGGLSLSQWIQTYLSGISVESVHIQNLNLVPFFFLFLFFHFLYIKKTLPEHYYLGPLDLFFLTPMKPEGQLCSGV